MNWKIILIAGIIIIALGAGAYAVTANKQDSAPAGDQTQPANAATTTVQAQDVSVGTGAEAKPGSVVSVLYVGKLPDGTIFDSSAAHNNEPLKFQLGAQGLIPGFQIGVNGMREGGERLLAIPPSLGYGAEDVKDKDGKVIIPANSTIVFDVKLVKVETAPAQPSATPAN